MSTWNLAHLLLSAFFIDKCYVWKSLVVYYFIFTELTIHEFDILLTGFCIQRVSTNTTQEFCYIQDWEVKHVVPMREAVCLMRLDQFNKETVEFETILQFFDSSFFFCAKVYVITIPNENSLNKTLLLLTMMRSYYTLVTAGTMWLHLWFTAIWCDKFNVYSIFIENLFVCLLTCLFNECICIKHQ